MLAKECRQYIATQYDDSVPFGEVSSFGCRSENLEAQTFESETFDLVVTMDVFEHLLEPDQAINEIARTLRPNGMHVMTVPIVNVWSPSQRRAGLVDGELKYCAEKQYHGNPMDPAGGALVTVDWGYDIADYLQRHSGMPTTIFNHVDLRHGIAGEFLDVVVSRKMHRSVLAMPRASQTTS